MNIAKWIYEQLSFLPRGDGQTATDNIIFNVFCKRLRNAGRQNDCDNISQLKSSYPDLTWNDFMYQVKQMYPTGIASQIEVFNRFQNDIYWSHPQPMATILKYLNLLDLDPARFPDHNTVSERLFTLLKLRLPEYLRHTNIQDTMTWLQIAQKLQEQRNQMREEELVEKNPTALFPSYQVMTVSSDPILNQVIMSSQEMPVNMTSMPSLPRKTDYRGNRQNFNNHRQKNLRNDGFMARRIAANQKNQQPQQSTLPQQVVTPMPQAIPTQNFQPLNIPSPPPLQRAPIITAPSQPHFPNQNPPTNIVILDSIQVAKQNIWSPLGLYREKPTQGRCYSCGELGHFSRDCIVKAILDLQGYVMSTAGENCGNIYQRSNPLDPEYLINLQQKWNQILSGQNPLHVQLKTISDLNRYLESQRSPSIQERLRAVEQEFIVSYPTDWNGENTNSYTSEFQSYNDLLNY